MPLRWYNAASGTVRHRSPVPGEFACPEFRWRIGLTKLVVGFLKVGDFDMSGKVEKITCKFIGEFKVGDNLVRNAKTLCKLVALADEQFNKLIVVQAGSIVEAALDQIIHRAKNFTKEGVPNVPEEDRKAIANAELEQFNNIIEAMKKYKILDALGASVYDDLHKLRQYRNRIHIQNDTKPKDVGRDDDKAFTKETTKWALGLNIKILKHLNEHYPRPKDMEQYAHDLEVPMGE
jgi:hypothetical protein